MIGNEYVPKPGPELAVYEGLWKVASPSGADLSGKDAVEFFRKSGVDIGFLKQIWSISTPSATMSHSQFATALRLITMVQNGDFPLNRERLIKAAETNYGPAENFPKFASIQLNVPQPLATTSVIPSHDKQTAASGAIVSVPPEAQVYAITPDDHSKYYNLFKGYDTNADGFLSGAEAVSVLAQSGLDQLVLRAIWELADQDKDNQLNAKEFCVAFHLIICISKRKLPLPVTLPPPLMNFLARAPMIPNAVTAAAAAATHVAPSVAYVPPAVSSVPSARKSAAQSESSAMSTTPTPAVPSQYIPEPTNTTSLGSPTSRSAVKVSYDSQSFTGSVNETEEDELTNSVYNIRDISRRALQVGDLAVESNISSSRQMKSVLQRLAQEKIALTAAVTTAELNAKESSEKLNDLVTEITSLEHELSDLRKQLDDSRSNNMSLQVQVSERTLEKQALLNKINDARASIAQKSSEVNTVAIDVGKSEGQRAELDDKEQSLATEIQNTQSDIHNINNELVVLQQILNSLQGDKDSRSADLVRLQSQKTASTNALMRQRSNVENQENTLNELKKEKNNLEQDRTNMLQQVYSNINSTGVAVTTDKNGSDKTVHFSPSTTTTPVAAASVSSVIKPSQDSTTPATAAVKSVTASKQQHVLDQPTSPVPPPTATTTPTTATTTSTSVALNSLKSTTPSIQAKTSFRKSKENVVTPLVPPPLTPSSTTASSLERKSSQNSILKKKQSVGKIMIRTHSMNNKYGEVDPFDDFGTNTPTTATTAAADSPGKEKAEINSPTIFHEDVVPFDVDFSNDLFESTASVAVLSNPTTVTVNATDGFGNGGFDQNPFESSPTAAASGQTPETSRSVGFGYDDVFKEEGQEDEQTNKSVHFTPSTKAVDGFENHNNDDDGFEASSSSHHDGFSSDSAIAAGFSSDVAGFSSIGFDKNPFDEPINFDAFGSSASGSEVNAFGSGISPFDAFGSSFGDETGVADAFGDASGAAGNKNSNSGFDDW